MIFKKPSDLYLQKSDGFCYFEFYLLTELAEELKADNQMAWVGRMNNIRNSATEIVNAEIIFTV